MISILSLLLVASLSLLVTRIATMALMLTGLSRESARFQARSAFTGVGFTTTESESVVSHPLRRQIVMWLMFLGNLGIATVVASTAISIVNTTRSERWWWNALVLVAGVASLVALSSSRWVEHRLNKLIAWGLRRWTNLDTADYVALLQLQSGYVVTEMVLEPEDWLAGRTLAEAALAQEGVLVLGIQRPDRDYIGTPQADDRIRAGDTLVLYGQIDRLGELDRRACGPDGELAHCDAVCQQEQRMATQVQQSMPSPWRSRS